MLPKNRLRLTICFTTLVSLLLLLSVSLTASPITADPTRFSVAVETGPTWQSRNSVQIPNDELGTRFALSDVAGDGPWLTARIDLSWQLREKHSLRALLAPFTYTEAGTVDIPISFANEVFLPGDQTEATYQFNSWRLTYRYRFHNSDRSTWWIGGTAKVRDAKIELQQGNRSARDTDVGFVPLLHLAGNWRLSERWHLAMDLDALAGGPGRAIDLGMRIGVDVSDRWTLAAGYRTLEGGADTDEVYNFAWFHSAVVSGIYRF